MWFAWSFFHSRFSASLSLPFYLQVYVLELLPVRASCTEKDKSSRTFKLP